MVVVSLLEGALNKEGADSAAKPRRTMGTLHLVCCRLQLAKPNLVQFLNIREIDMRVWVGVSVLISLSQVATRTEYCAKCSLILGFCLAGLLVSLHEKMLLRNEAELLLPSAALWRSKPRGSIGVWVVCHGPPRNMFEEDFTMQPGIRGKLVTCSPETSSLRRITPAG
jgi:hypothetical protein